MGTVLTDKARTGAHVVSEAGGATSGMRSRDKVTLLTGALYEPGMVLGQVTASKKFAPLAPAAVDGSEAAVAVCFDHYDASVADVDGVVHRRECEVNDAELIWPDGISENDKAAAIAALADVGIIVR